MFIKSELRAEPVPQTAVFVQLKRQDLAVAVDKSHSYTYSVCGILECMHFPVFSISHSILPE
jgi:hypothetical protein